MANTTCAQIAYIKKLQGVLSALAVLNMNGYMYPNEANIYDGATYDYLVVGGGTAGVVVAARLAEAKSRVLLIEAGGNSDTDSLFPGLVTFLTNSRIDWNFTLEEDGFTGKCHRSGTGSLFGKVLGGSGETNLMIYARGNPRDYEKFYQATNDSSWKWNNMLKYFKRSQNLQALEILNSPYKEYHGTDGKIGVIKENRPVCDDYLQGFEEAGEAVVTDNIGAGILGYSSGLYHIRDGIRNGVAGTYLPTLKDNSKLQITRHSLATEIIFDEHKNAIGVKFVKNDKTFTVKAKKEVIVSCGTIKSPQLLMLSGIGPKEELEKMKINMLSDIPVGKNLQNVVGALLGFKTNRKADPKPFNAHQYPAPLLIGYTALNKSSNDPDYQTLNFIIDDYTFLLSFCGMTLGFKNSICDRLHLLANNTQILLTIIINVDPKSRGEILLRSTDPHEQPKIISGRLTNDVDLDNLVEHIIDYIKIEGTPHSQSLGLEFMEATNSCSHFEFGSREYWRCYALCMIATTGRDCGTCSMGCVVDNQLCVYGVKKLRVVDASVMPNTVGGEIFAPEVALAEKAAEMIIESNKS